MKNFEVRYSRQGFIGDQNLIEKIKVAVVGLGGGGSCVVTELAHVGFQNIIGFDPCMRLEEKHLNRTLGITVEDVKNGLTKAQLAERVVRNLQPSATTNFIVSTWQDQTHLLRDAELVIGCIDGFKEREQLEIFCRRHMLPYIDIGLGLTSVEAGIPVLAGQVVASVPDYPCFRCLGFLNEARLSEEAVENYGDATVRPQVLWGNLKIASTAVSLAVKLVTGWAGPVKLPFYQQYDGNADTVMPHPRLTYLAAELVCPHFPLDRVGRPFFDSEYETSL